MFVDFLFELRRFGLRVTAHEWLALMEAVTKGLHRSSLKGFYSLARSLCVKDINQYDAFDQAFLFHFRGIEPAAITLADNVLHWLNDPKNRDALTEQELAQIASLDMEQLRKMFEERLREQTERHDGGSRWVGTGGTSPFGRAGAHPTGMRVGAGGQRSAMQVAGERRFRPYRTDAVLDVRQIDVALRGLRRLGRDGTREELDLDATVDETCRNAGDLELVFRAPRRNRVKVALLMDVGGSMDPYAKLVGRLFTAASRTGRFSRFRSYYFHNCIYDRVYEDASFRDSVLLADLLAQSSRSERVVIVGDALMHPSELLDSGTLYYSEDREAASGLTWLRRVADHFERVAWFNPEPERYWPRTTIEVVASVFPMWPLSVAGLEAGVRYLSR